MMMLCLLASFPLLLDGLPRPLSHLLLGPYHHQNTSSHVPPSAARSTPEGLTRVNGVVFNETGGAGA